MAFVKDRLFTPIIFLFAFTFSTGLRAQSSSHIYHELLKLKETKRILYIAAHPDDENTRLIAYLANEEHAQVAYLSLTRGDGGQNLIGKELGVELGMIRTQELLRARETDGGMQYFTRAIDFGFSKNPDETLNNWDKEKLLSDVAWVIRNYQPDIIINRFNTEPGTTHGHHTTSAILALEAFTEAGKSTAFPEQLEWVNPWSSKRIFWNGYNWGGQYEPTSDKHAHAFPVGDYNPLLGTTYSQIAADSRTMHKSQGFGATAQIGRGEDFIELIGGEPFGQDPFEGIVNRWTTIPKGSSIESAIAGVLDQFDFLDPAQNVPALLKVKNLLDAVVSDEPWILEKQDHINEIILRAMGIKTRFNANKELGFPSEAIHSALIVNNPSSIPVEVTGYSLLDNIVQVRQTLKDNESLSLNISLDLPAEYPISQPYWLLKPLDNSLFTVEDQSLIGRPYNAPAVLAKVIFSVDGTEVTKEIPLKYQYNDPVDGEVNQPFTVVPEIQLSLNKENLFLLNNQPEILEVDVQFLSEINEGNLVLEGLSPRDYQLLDKKLDADKKRVIYRIRISGAPLMGKSVIHAKYETPDGIIYGKGMKRISYKHIPNLTYFPDASFNLIQLDLNISRQKIGYIRGAGDDIPQILASLGYEVTYLENGSLDARSLSQYQTVIIGIRAFNTNPHLASQVDEVMKYVESGGNLIVQYNTSSSLLSRKLGPYPFQLSRTRVAVEDSPVRIFEDHAILNRPNKVEISDFDGWVQERGLYFPADWDDRYITPFSMADPGEPASEGALLLAEYGKGTYSYSGISWFRLLPAGVPGAIKIFVNLIEQADER